MNGRLLVVGDALLERDIEGRAERACRPGGAGLAAVLAARNGRPVTLLTALASDRGARKLARLLLDAGVDLIDLGLCGRTPERVRLLRPGKPPLCLERSDSPERVERGGAATTLRVALDEADGVLVTDGGRGLTSVKAIREALARRAKALPLIWDPHPRGTAPLAGTALATPSLAEALGRTGGGRPENDGEIGKLASALARRWEAEQIALTLGPDGALLAPASRGPLHVRCAKVAGASTGAGVMFAAEAASRLADGRASKDAVTSAVAAATRFVSEGYVREDRLRLLGRQAKTAKYGEGSPSPSPSLAKALEMAERVRRRGGTISATDGCFDVLHPADVRCLEAAARFGDRLVVLVDSERSGSVEALRDLACVGEVAIFDGPTPIDALRLLRPEVWAKSGIPKLYAQPESREASWGGRVAILPRESPS